MKANLWKGGLIWVGCAALAFVVAGCTKQDAAPKADAKGKAKGTEVAENTDKKGHDHSDWWCAEHGVPEEMCSMCSPKVAAECKKKGDWCEKHDRADSQCFICHPEKKEKFVAMYRAKYGKEPPPIEDEKKDDTKKDETKKDGSK
jgi:hypothetical protein